MAESQNSYKKIEAVSGISSKATLFITDGCEALAKLKGNTEVIGVPLFDSIYNVMADTMKSGVELLHTCSEELANICKEWGSRSGFGSKAVAAFEEAEKTVRAVIGVEYTGSPCQESDGLHEQATAENVGAFTTSLIEFIQVKNNFIYGFAQIRDEFAEKDSEAVLNEIGGGMEKFTNAIVDCIDSNKDALVKFGVNLEEVDAAVKSKASNIAEAGNNTAKATRGHSALED